ncbi:hypothetical protein [Streptomyces sp. MUM 178J]|uniref:hypothetical protein n=1 Tax=Streptomyces sp. MUM 178J TaxID=2791991 RepID=UPI001F03D858|nr:hypothetical protein [Streptomyces sp. MUM 178J]WRQ80343.1 hypothetical protein I3F59_013865 [Streptomyces sp. MUM 178J]
MTTDYGVLDTAATAWDKVAAELKKAEARYKTTVSTVATGPAWTGIAAGSAQNNFAGTQYEYAAAQTQAKATAKLLRAGRKRFDELKRILDSARADAIEAGMRVSEQGNVGYDYDKLTAQERAALQADPKALQGIKESEESWADYIKACVRNFDEADKDLKASLDAVVKDSVGDKNDATLGTGFNGRATGELVSAAEQNGSDDDVKLDLNSLLMDTKTETLSTWSARAQGDIVARLSGNEQWGKLYARYVTGAVSIAAFARATNTTVSGAFALIQAYRDPTKLLNAQKTLYSQLVNGSRSVLGSGELMNRVSPALRTALGGSNAVAAQYGSYMKNGTLITPTATQANLLRVADSGGLANAAKAAGAMRGLGIVGSAGATVYGVVNLSTYDSEKISNNPDKFASDLTGTAFNASLTAAMVAPNPVTVGLAVGTGVAYAGALVWENREEIGEAWDKTTDWAGDTASDIGSGIASGAKKVGSFLNPFD